MIEAARIPRQGEIELAELLTVERIETGCQMSSKKRLMEKIMKETVTDIRTP